MAMAGIILFFSSGLESYFLSLRSVQVVERISSNAQFFVNSPTTCDSAIIQLPRTINIFSASDVSNITGKNYLLKIKPVINPNGEDINRIIFTLVDFKHPEKVIAARSLETKASINLFYLNDEALWVKHDKDEIILNPLKANGADNRLVMIKEGLITPELVVFPCNVDYSTKEFSSTCDQTGFYQGIWCLRAGKSAGTTQPETFCSAGRFQCFDLAKES